MSDKPQHIQEWQAAAEPFGHVADSALRCPVCGNWWTSIDALAPYHWETCYCATCNAMPLEPK